MRDCLLAGSGGAVGALFHGRRRVEPGEGFSAECGIGEAVSGCGPERRAGAVDPAPHVVDALVAVLDGLDEALQLVGVAGDDHLRNERPKVRIQRLV